VKGFVSISTRLKVNMESLNGIESIGNLSRHRTAPIVVPTDEGYQIRYVPVVSGESIAHALQSSIVSHSKEIGLPVGKYSENDEFIKFTDDKIMEKEGIKPPKDIDDARRAEVDVMLADTVCDVGGFLYAGKSPIKRTARFQVGYMIPAHADIEASALEAQFHVRHSPSETKKGAKGESRYQIPYNVEVASAIYTFTINLDISGISVPSTSYGKKSPREPDLEEQRQRRIKATLTALTELMSGMTFGAKRSRFLPNTENLSTLLSYSANTTFSVSPGNSGDYVRETSARKDDFVRALSGIGSKPEIVLSVYDKEKCSGELEIPRASSVEGLLADVVELITSRDEN
jgi:CRISPR-associated protein Csa2